MIRKILDKIGAKWILLVIMSIAYLIVAFINLDLFENMILTFTKVFWKILPILPLVFGLIFLSNLFFDPKRITKYLGEKAGLKGWFISIFWGIISHGPSYMWYPLLSELKEKGMKISFIATFLYNRAIKIPLLPMLIFYFGWSFTLVLTGLMIMFSIGNGIIVEKLMGVKK
jgi:uncharacterized membrane protein YraQ (UPF0718 family)